jgi:acetyl esterase
MRQGKMLVTPPRGGIREGLTFGYVDVPKAITPDTRPFLDSLTQASLELQQRIRKGREVALPTRDVTIEAGGLPTKVRLFLPEGPGPFPLVLYSHGGGFAIRDVECFDYIGRYLANAAQAVVVMPDYALAPEHPFPTQLEQCYDTLLWARSHAAELCARETWDTVAGDSAGGNLSAAICLKCLIEGVRVPAMQILAYPVVDMRQGALRESEERYGTGYNLDYQHLLAYNAAYATPDQRCSPLASPLLAPSLRGMPPCLMVSAECDVLIDQGMEFLQRLKDDGVRIEYRIFTGMPHDFLFFDYPESYEAYELIAGKIRDTRR